MSAASNSDNAPAAGGAPAGAPAAGSNDVSSLAKEMGSAVKSFDDQDSGSVPLEKDMAKEKEILQNLKLENEQLPQSWMGLACVRCRKYDEARAKLLMTDFGAQIDVTDGRQILEKIGKSCGKVHRNVAGFNKRSRKKSRSVLQAW